MNDEKKKKEKKEIERGKKLCSLHNLHMIQMIDRSIDLLKKILLLEDKKKGEEGRMILILSCDYLYDRRGKDTSMALA